MVSIRVKPTEMILKVFAIIVNIIVIKLWVCGYVCVCECACMCVYICVCVCVHKPVANREEGECIVSWKSHCKIFMKYKN